MGGHSVHQPSTTFTKVKTQLKRIPIGVFIGVALIIAALLLYLNTRHSEQRAETATNNVNRVADPILVLCQQGGETAQKLNDAGLCGTAAAIKENPNIVTERPVDDDHIIELIDAELAKRPVGGGAAPSMGQLIDAARAVINSNPDAFRGPAGPPGATGSSADLASAVAAYVTGHPDVFRGPPGAPGQPGQAGQTGSNGQPGQPGQQGPAGPTGPAGPAGPQGETGETGPAGPAGADGTAGTAGSGCPSGTSFSAVTFADGRTGQACVDDGSTATGSGTTGSGTTGGTTTTTTEPTAEPLLPPLISTPTTTEEQAPTGDTRSPGLTIPLPLLGR